MTRRQEMMRRVQQLDFVLYDVSLFLNNHPENAAGLNLFAKYKTLATQARQEYEEAFGPLTHGGMNVERDGWSWIHMPWPWELEV